MQHGTVKIGICHKSIKNGCLRGYREKEINKFRA